MWDLLRAARFARTFLGLVGLWRYGFFRAFAVAVTCAGLGFTVAGAGAHGLFIGVAFFAVYSLVRATGSAARRFG